MKNTTKDDATEKEFLSWCDSVGIKFTPAQLETLRRCSGYAQPLIDRGASSWPVGLPLTNKPTAKPAAKITFDDIATSIWKNRKNSFYAEKKGERNAT